MPLKDLKFSDIILLSKGGGAYLKGTPEADQMLLSVPPDCADEAVGLLKLVCQEFNHNSWDPNLSLRVTFAGCSYRAAMYDDVVSGHAFFLRKLAAEVPSLDSLGFPASLVEWLTDRQQCKGLILLVGGQGAGKTTTASALIKSRLTLHGGHAVSFENPVEMPLSGQHGEHGYCFQAEIRSESELESHIERSHRYGSPNIIYIGEIRSKYAASIALQVALGSPQQLVVATIHGTTIATALRRLLTWAREKDGDVACQNLSQTILGIVHQELSDPVNAKRELKLPEFLLVPFDKSDESSTAIRTKLADGRLNLDDDIRAQRNYLTYSGRATS